MQKSLCEREGKNKIRAGNDKGRRGEESVPETGVIAAHCCHYC